MKLHSNGIIFKATVQKDVRTLLAFAGEGSLLPLIPGNPVRFSETDSKHILHPGSELAAQITASSSLL